MACMICIFLNTCVCCAHRAHVFVLCVKYGLRCTWALGTHSWHWGPPSTINLGPRGPRRGQGKRKGPAISPEMGKQLIRRPVPSQSLCNPMDREAGCTQLCVQVDFMAALLPALLRRTPRPAASQKPSQCAHPRHALYCTLSGAPAQLPEDTVMVRCV